MTKREGKLFAKKISKKFFTLLLKYGEKAARIYIEGEVEKLRRKYENN